MESEKLNLKKAKKILDNLFKDWLDVTIEIEDNRLNCEADITVKVYDDDIYMWMEFFDNGHCNIHFWFDYLDKNEQALSLVNSFNENVLYLKAYFDVQGMLRVTYADYILEDTIAQTVQRVFDDLVAEDTVKYLKPLIDLTHPAQEGSSAIESEKLNLENAKKILDNLFKDWLDVTTEIKDDHIDVVATLIEEAYGDDIDIYMRIFDNGYYFMCSLFDYLDKNEKTLDLVNSFNDNVLYLKATFDDEDQLTVRYDAYVAENTIAHTVNKVLDFLVDEDTVKYLKPLIELTHPKDKE